jgi:hypothetical protein
MRWTGISRGLTLAMTGAFALQLMAAPVHLRVDRRADPIGLGDASPVLSWQSDAATQNWKQSAYEVYVASSPKALAGGGADVWKSGRVASPDSINIAYKGPALQARRRYYWSVRVWDATGKSTMAPEPAYWEMGLLSSSDWHAQWIRSSSEEQQDVLKRINWLWLPKGDSAKVPQGTKAEFKYTLHLDHMPDAASMHVYVGGTFTAKVNGVQTGHKEEWSSFDREDIRDALHSGSGVAGPHRRITQPFLRLPQSPFDSETRPVTISGSKVTVRGRLGSWLLRRRPIGCPRRLSAHWQTTASVSLRIANRLRPRPTAWCLEQRCCVRLLMRRVCLSRPGCT